MNRSKLLFGLGLLLLFWSCAQQVAPTGGEKDEDPPEIISIEPEQEVLNYENEKIVIQFDEFIQMKNLKKNFLSSPPLEHDLETRVRGKRLEIEVIDTLQENTTYVFNFGNAIADFHEGNPIEGFTYVFSTGNEIDTLSLSGRLVEAFSLEVVDEAVLMLYDTTDLDSLPFKRLPKYVDRTDKEGRFKLTNLKAGKYVLFALSDKNTNYLFDKPDELVAYSDSLILLDDKVDSIKLYGFLEDREKQFVESQKENGPLVALVFNKTLSDSIDFRFLDTLAAEVLHSYQYSKGRDSLLFWFKEMDKQEFEVEITAGEYIDTLELKADSLPSKSKLEFERGVSVVQDYFRPFQIEFKRPIKSYDTAFISLRKSDSSLMPYTLIQDSVRLQNFVFEFDLKEDSSYFIELFPGAFTDIYGQTLDTTLKRFRVNNRRDFGNLEVRVQIKDSLPKLLQLLDQSGKVLTEEVLSDSSMAFPNLKAGDYGLKLILDRNGNGKWDTGVFAERKQAEQVYIYDEKISIRANWDQEIEWVIK
ncbi:MAG: Ig-like domain-containing protein [Vicingaceae bacterium]